MNIYSRRIISLKTPPKQILFSCGFFFVFQKNHLEGKIYLPKAIKMRGRKIKKKNVPRAKYVRTIQSRYKHPFSPGLCLFNMNIKVCRRNEWVTGEGKMIVLKCCSLESISIIRELLAATQTELRIQD